MKIAVKICGLNAPDAIAAAARRTKPGALPKPVFGDGHAADQIAAILARYGG